MNPRTLFVATIVTFGVAISAAAHEMHLYVAAEGNSLKGKAYFEDDAPAANMTVLVETEEGEEIASLSTDEDGTFVYTPDAAHLLVFVATTPDGHRETFKVDAAEVASILTPPVAGAEEITGDRLAQQIAALREQTNDLQQRLWLRDVIGGIGYIVGVLGLFAFWKARQSRS